MSDDILEFKPGVGPFKLNVNALLRRLFRESAGAAQVTAGRFLRVFAEHGVAAAQIPRFIPKVSLAALAKEDALLTALTPEVLDQVALLFGIQRAWLEGASDRLYRPRFCYQHPEAFFEFLRGLPFKHGAFQIRILTSASQLDYQSDSAQPLAMVAVEKLASVEDVDELWDIERYHIFGDAWDWGHLPCRIQLKAMVRTVDRLGHQPVPLFKVKSAELEAVLAGRCIPKRFVNRCLLSEPSLEDYACSAAEHAKAKETAELPFVLDYMKEERLAAMWSR